MNWLTKPGLQYNEIFEANRRTLQWKEFKLFYNLTERGKVTKMEKRERVYCRTTGVDKNKDVKLR